MEHINSFNYLDKLISYLRISELKKNFQLKNKKIIDFGCGSDFKALKNVYKECQKITLIDRVTENFEDGNLNFINFKNNLDILNKKVDNELYDIIILTAVIEHLESPEEILNILKTKLNNNGYFFLTAPGKRSKWLLEFLAYKLGIINENLVREHKRYYDKKEYEILSQKTNLEIKNFYFFEFGFNTVCILK